MERLPLDDRRLQSLAAAAVVCVGCVIAAQYVVNLSIADRLLGASLTSTLQSGARAETALALGQRLLLLAAAFGGLLTYARLGIQGRTDNLLVLLLLFLPINSRFPIQVRTLYTDQAGLIIVLDMLSVLLAVAFTVLLRTDPEWVARATRDRLCWPFLVLVTCAVLTQTYHLGLQAGLGIAYVRVVQPMMFLILLAHEVRTRNGLRRVMGWLVGSVVLAVAIRFITPTLVDAGTGRAFAIGSWTIYGTILSASIPIVVSLWLTAKSLPARLALLACAGVIAPEIFLTGTRGAVLGLVALGLFALDSRIRKYAAVAVALSLMIYIAIGESPSIELTGQRMLALNPQSMVSDPNAQVRIDRNLLAWDYIWSHPVEGLGLGAPVSLSTREIAFWVYNPYLAWGVSMGVAAMLSFLLIMVGAVGEAVRNWRRADEETRLLELGVLATLGVWLINQFTTGDSLTYMQSVESILFFYSVVGLILGRRLSRLGETTERPAATLPHWQVK